MTMTAPTFMLGHYMRLALEEADLTVEGIADELGVSRTTVSRWLNNKGLPRKGDLALWAQLCGVPLEWLQTAPVARPEGLEPPTFWLGADLARQASEWLAWQGLLCQLTPVPESPIFSTEERR